MKILKATWAIVRIILTLIIALLVVDAAESKFESVLASSVLMIYTAVRLSAIVQFHYVVDQTKALTEQFLELAELLKYPRLAEFRSNLDVQTKRNESESRYGDIEGISLILVSIIAVINLVLAIL